MRALLLGFGDLGQRLAARLLRDGWQVTGVRRSRAQVSGVEMIAGDCRDPALLATLLAGRDLVVASLTPDSFTEEAYREAYVASARALAEALAGLADKPRLVLWVSSTSVYGQGEGEWVDEKTPPAPSGFSGRLLLAAERELAAADAPTAIVRFSGIYGGGSKRMLDQVRRGQCAPESPVQWSNRIHRDDCAGVLHHLAALALAGEPLAPVYLGTDCEPAPLHQVHRWLAEQLGVAVAVGNSAAGRRGNRRCSNRLLLESGYRFLYPSYREGYAEDLSGS